MSELHLLICDACPDDAHTLAVERVQVHRMGDRKEPPWIDLCAEHFAALPVARSNGRVRTVRASVNGQIDTSQTAENASGFRCDEHQLEWPRASGARVHWTRYHGGRGGLATMAAQYVEARSAGRPAFPPAPRGNAGKPRSFRTEYRCEPHEWEGPGQAAAAHWRYRHRSEWGPKAKATMRRAYDAKHPA